MTQTQIFGLIVAALLWSILSIVFEFGETSANIIWTPKDIYNRTRFNMFGSWFLFIGLCIISPFMAFGKFIYWIFHVGRKDE